MESLKAIFLEDPLYLYIIMLLAEVVLVALWQTRRTPKLAWLLLAPPILAGAAWGLDALVVTDREKLHAAAQELARDFQARQFDSLEKYVDQNYSGFCGNRTRLLKQARQESKQRNIQHIRVLSDKIEITGPHAEMTVTSIVRLKGDFTATLSLKWSVYWQKTPDGWRIAEISPPTPTMPGF